MKVNAAAIHNSWDREVKKAPAPAEIKRIDGSQIMETIDYERFRYVAKNRPISPDKVNHFIRMFEDKKFFLRDFPGVVDRDYVILDGQHRFEACRALNLPFYFRFADQLTIDNIVDVQINAGWKTSDFLHAYIKQGKQDYIILQRFMNKYKFAATTAAMVLSDKNNDGTGLKKLGFYDGTFHVKNEKKAHINSQAILDLGDLALGLNRDRTFCIAVIHCMAHEEFDIKRMKDQLIKWNSMMKRHVNIEGYMRNLEEIYNYRLYQRNKVRFI